MWGKKMRAGDSGRESAKPGNAAAEKFQKPDAHLTLHRHLLIFQFHEQTQVCPHILVFGSKCSFFFIFFFGWTHNYKLFINL